MLGVTAEPKSQKIATARGGIGKPQVLTRDLIGATARFRVVLAQATQLWLSLLEEVT
jgi:hypothetical protein